MRHWFGVTAAFLVGATAIAIPLLISIQLAWREGIADETTLATGYARDVLHRTDETAAEMGAGIAQLNAAHYPPCSPPDLNLMRVIDVSSSYVQAVGRIVGNNLVCTSLGSTDPIPVGPPTLVTEHGATERLYVQLPLANHAVDVFSMDGIAFIIDPWLTIDTPTEGPNTSIAVFVPSSPNHAMLASRNPSFKPAWFRPIPKGSFVTFHDSGYVVAIARSAYTDVAVITAAPDSYASRHVHRFALVFIPFGLLCAAVLAWVVAHVSRSRFSLPSIIRSGARRHEFFVEYQPIVDLQTRQWVGAEALVSWQRADGRILRPDSFIPVAEESGAITHITLCVTDIVAADLPSLLRISPDFAVAINLSAADLHSEGTIGLVQRILKAGNGRPGILHVEATERGLMQGPAPRDTLANIRSLGVKVAIDDFGTGYSSLSYLQSLQIDTLKIDKSFIDTIGTGAATNQVVKHIIDMAHSLKLTMVGEGVETEEQAGYLAELGVQYAQGWLFSKPLSIAALRNALETRKQDPNLSRAEPEPSGRQ